MRSIVKLYVCYPNTIISSYLLHVDVHTFEAELDIIKARKLTVEFPGWSRWGLWASSCSLTTYWPWPTCISHWFTATVGRPFRVSLTVCYLYCYRAVRWDEQSGKFDPKYSLWSWILVDQYSRYRQREERSRRLSRWYALKAFETGDMDTPLGKVCACIFVYIR